MGQQVPVTTVFDMGGADKGILAYIQVLSVIDYNSGASAVVIYGDLLCTLSW